MSSSYSLGLHEVGQGAYAYLQPDGGWGYSNAGLLVGDGRSLLVDTLFDLKLTEAMLGAMRSVTDGSPIGTVVNTHANGDHCYGNQLVGGAEIVASSATAHEMTEVPPAMMAALNAADGDVGDLFRSFFGDFDFSGIDLAMPTRTFDGRLDLDVGGRVVELIEVGPAHTKGDTIVHCPETKTVFTGDILFIGGAPIVWAGPLENWIAACDLIVTLEVEDDDRFARHGDDLVYDVQLSFSQAALGVTLEVPTPWGEEKLKIEPGTQPGTVLRLKGKEIGRAHV